MSDKALLHIVRNKVNREQYYGGTLHNKYPLLPKKIVNLINQIHRDIKKLVKEMNEYNNWHQMANLTSRLQANLLINDLIKNIKYNKQELGMEISYLQSLGIPNLPIMTKGIEPIYIPYVSSSESQALISPPLAPPLLESIPMAPLLEAPPLDQPFLTPHKPDLPKIPPVNIAEEIRKRRELREAEGRPAYVPEEKNIQEKLFEELRAKVASRGSRGKGFYYKH